MGLLTLLKSPASGGAAWTPAELSSIIDYGDIADLSYLKQNSDGSGAVASDGDPVGYWSGKLGSVIVTEANAANKPTYKTYGVDFKPGATQRKLVYNLGGSRTAAEPFFMAMKFYYANNNSGIGVRLGFYSAASFVVSNGFYEGGAGQAISVRGFGNTSQSSLWNFTSGISATPGTYNLSINRTASGATGYLENADPKTLNIGTDNAAQTYINFGKGNTNDFVSAVVKWVICSADLSEADRALVQTWMES